MGISEPTLYSSIRDYVPKIEKIIESSKLKSAIN